MKRRVLLTTLGGGILAMRTAWAQGPAPGSTPAPEGRGPRWAQDAEKTFGMGRGPRPKLMTEEAWTEHQAKMRAMMPEECQKDREETARWLPSGA
jgi:hypothetical protein